MTDKIDPEVMETLKEVRKANDARIKEVAKIEALDEFERAIGRPNTESEKFVSTEKVNITKVDRELKKRGA